MSTSARLTAVFSSADEISFDDASKFILFSDCHRGDNSWADDFAPNQQLLFFALQHYLDAGFTYIEVGDGDELWENGDFAEIRRAHSHIFWLMREFYRDNRLYLMYGNHDIERQDPEIVARTLYQYDDERTRTTQPLFEGIKVHEGLILHHTNTNNRIFLVHGHQADPVSDRWWRFSRFMVRHFWRHLQLLGLHDPTSPAQNYKKRGKVERQLTQWIETQNQMLIAGHTHRSCFPDEGKPPYFNTGSCVHPRCITGIELLGRDISLIKWSIKPNDEGVLIVARDVLAGPRKMW
jgi:UDP-2,3-diacylglucosamine pyrophosphatase LpxH